MLRHESWKFTDELCVSPAVARSLSIVIVGAIKVLSTAEVTYISNATIQPFPAVILLCPVSLRERSHRVQ